MFKVIIIGGRNTKNYGYFEEKCKNCLKNKAKEGIMIYSTGDEFVDLFAKRFSIDVRFFPSDFKTFGNNALKHRNEMMFTDAQALIAFNDGLKDTEILISIAKEKGIPCRIINKNNGG